MQEKESLIEKLLELYFGKRGTRVIVCLVLMMFGISHTTIQQKYGTALSTLRRYKRALDSGSIESLFVVAERERERSELDDYEKEILANFEENPPRTLREAQTRIESLTGLKRSLVRLRVWLLKRGFIPAQ